MKEYIITDDFLDDLTMKSASAQGQLKELIRCKDCKYWKVGRCHNANNGDGAKYYYAPIKSKDGHCDWAERKE